MFNYAFDGKADSEFFLPGTPIKVVATPGLNGVNKIYAIRLSNMFLGTDLLYSGLCYLPWFQLQPICRRFACGLLRFPLLTPSL